MSKRMPKAALYRKEGKIKWDPSIHQLFCSKLVEIYGYKDAAYSQVLNQLALEWSMKAGDNMVGDYNMKKTYIVKLSGALKAIRDNAKDHQLYKGDVKQDNLEPTELVKALPYDELMDIIKYECDSTDSQGRTQKRYFRELTKIGAIKLITELRSNTKHSTHYEINIQIIDKLIERADFFKGNRVQLRDMVNEHLEGQHKKALNNIKNNGNALQQVQNNQEKVIL